MADTVWDLSARITADTSGADRGLTHTQQKVVGLAKEFTNLNTKTSNLKGAFQGLASSSSSLGGPLGNLVSQFSSLASGGVGAATSAGAVGAAFGLLASASIGAAVGIYKIVAATSEATGHLHDLSQRTNFSVETLSALQHAAETSGGSIETVSSALGIFQRNMEEAASGNEEMSRVFKALNIDVKDNEKALRQAFEILSQMPAGAQQTALSMKLFGRSGREVQAIFKEAGGDLDAFISKLRDEGLLVTSEAAKKGDELSDSITRIGQRFSAVGRQVGTEFAPMVERALANFDTWLRNNSNSIKETAGQVANLIQWAAKLSETLSFLSFKPFVIQVQLAASMVGEGWNYLGKLIPSQPTVTGGTYMELDPTTGRNVRKTWGSGRQGNWRDEGEYVSPGSTVPGALGRINIPTGTGKGGGGGGGRGTKSADPAISVLKQLQDEYARLADSTKLAEVNQRLLDERFKKSNPAIVEQIRATAELIDKRNQESEANKQIMAASREHLEKMRRAAEEQLNIEDQVAQAVQRLRDELTQLQFGEETQVTSATKFVAKLQKMAEAAGGMTEQTRKLIAELFKLAATIDQVTDEKARAEKWGKLGDAIGFPDSGDYDKDERRAEEERMRRVQDMASQITYALDNAIYDGFQGGIKRGLASLLTSMLDMIKNVLMKRLEADLTEALAKIDIGAGGGGKGGFLSGLIGILGGALGGIFGGGGGGSWGKMGGKIGFPAPVPLAGGMSYVPFDGFPAMLHKGERVLTAAENAAGGGGNHYHTWNVSTPNPQSFMGRDTQTQISHKMQTVMKNAAVRVS